jgi:hypothetical protein
MEDLYNYIFVGAMVLIRDFYEAFGMAWTNPDVPEAEMSLEMMAFFVDLVCRLDPDNRVVYEKIIPPLLAKKAQAELAPLADRTVSDLETKISNDVHTFAAAPATSTTIGNLPVASLVDSIATAVKREDDTIFKDSATECVTQLVQEAIPFQELITQYKSPKPN